MLTCHQPHCVNTSETQAKTSHPLLRLLPLNSTLAWHARAKLPTAAARSQWLSCMPQQSVETNDKTMFTRTSPLKRSMRAVTMVSFVSVSSGFYIVPIKQQSLYSGWTNKWKDNGLWEQRIASGLGAMLTKRTAESKPHKNLRQNQTLSVWWLTFINLVPSKLRQGLSESSRGVWVSSRQPGLHNVILSLDKQEGAEKPLIAKS